MNMLRKKDRKIKRHGVKEKRKMGKRAEGSREPTSHTCSVKGLARYQDNCKSEESNTVCSVHSARESPITIMLWVNVTIVVTGHTLTVQNERH